MKHAVVVAVVAVAIPMAIAAGVGFGGVMTWLSAHSGLPILVLCALVLATFTFAMGLVQGYTARRQRA